MISGGAELLNGLLDPSNAVRYPRQVELLQQDRPSVCAFFIVSGIIKLVYLDQNGREVIVALKRPGWIVGASALILNEPNHVTAVTITSCQVVRLNAEQFARLVKTDPRFSQYLHQLSARDIEDHISNLVDIVCLPALDRLSKFLSEVACSFGLAPTSRAGETVVPLKHWEIAELLGITPEHLSRLLKLLESKGVVHRRRSTILVPDGRRFGSS